MRRLWDQPKKRPIHYGDIGKRYRAMLPNRARVWARYMGELAPGQRAENVKLSDEYLYNGHYWI